MQEKLSSLEHQKYGKYTLSKHIGDLLQAIVREQPADPLGSIETMSTLLWKQRHVQTKTQSPGVPEEELDRCTSIITLLEELNSDSRSKLDTTFFDTLDKWSSIGITLSQESSLMLQCSLIKLAESDEISNVRFWGLFNTPKGNLYIAEADISLEFRSNDIPAVGPYDVPPEVGVGVNRYVYYSTKSPFDDWVRLPDLRPSDIVRSRQITWQLSGDLSSAIHSIIPFEVTEDVYLRTLIARITSSTMVAPNGYFMEYISEEEEKNEEPENNDENEEESEKELPPKQLKLVVDVDFEGADVENVDWVHIRPYILPQGRETYKRAPKQPKPPRHKKIINEDGEEEEEEEEEVKEEEDEPEESVELFTSIENDEGFDEDNSCWNLKTIMSVIEGESFAIAESLRWPGAYNITDGKKACSIYYGDGNKVVVNGFQPPKPPKLAKEYRRKMTEIIDPTLDEEKEIERLKNPPEEEEEEEEDQ
ncbi:radial spoke head protein 6 A-like [Histomonas meleagridis]|uniref:radial spoke head protein 6-like A-like n=1 Tax=Histomonas meleagridis TaxID=135588 RepID=UPI003559FE03|nr:radial spoke head protein 6 A-like [Histomonas meleagridis]KAH0798223.1 radial spoke head protein 6-like A-like [Histomonas meleagridis]